MSKKLLLGTIVLIISAGVLSLSGVFSFPLLLVKSIDLPSAFWCTARGGKWVIEMRRWGIRSGYCYEIFADGGKPCTNSSECLSHACVIWGGEMNQMENGGIVGKCREKDSFEQRGRPSGKPYCGEALIESGKIGEDMRQCIVD